MNTDDRISSPPDKTSETNPSPTSNQVVVADPHKVFYTSKEVLEQGIKFSEPPPPPTKCKFCGKTLYYEAVVLNNAFVACWRRNFPQRCTCPQAVEFWKKYDEREAKKKAQEETMKKKEQAQKAWERKIARLLKRSGIPQRFLQRTFEHFKTADSDKLVQAQKEQAYRKAKAYCADFKKHKKDGSGLYFEGTNGTGKTHLAIAIALELLNSGTSVICKTAKQLLSDIKRTYDRDDVLEEEVLDVYKNVDLLIIDDLGKENCTRWTLEILFEIINTRYEEMKPIIITTNYGEEDLIKRETDKGGDNSNIMAIVSRLRECTEVVTMAWKDYRSERNDT